MKTENHYHTPIKLSTGACQYHLEIPIVLKGLDRYAYRVLTLNASLRAPSLKFSTDQVTLLPTPLKATITTSLEVTATNFLT